MINKEIQEQHIAERMTFFASNIADFEIGEEVKADGTISKMLKRYINYIFPAYKLKFKI